MKPSTEETFLQRICTAIELTPRELAKRIGVKYTEIEPLLSPRHLLAEIDRDDTWWKIAELVNARVGTLLAVKAEMNKALQRDRTKRAARMAAQRKFPGRSSPRW